MVRCFFLLIHFLVVEDYELPKSTSHILSVPLTMECVRILSWSISFFLLKLFSWWCLLNLEVTLEISSLSRAILALKETRLCWWCCSQQVEMSCSLILKTWKCHTRNIRKCTTFPLLFFYFSKLIHIDLKPRILMALFLLAPVLNN